MARASTIASLASELGLKTRRAKPREKPAAPITERESDEARELMLYAVNDGWMYEHMTKPIETMLAKRIAAGTYDRRKAPHAGAGLEPDLSAGGAARSGRGHGATFRGRSSHTDTTQARTLAASRRARAS